VAAELDDAIVLGRTAYRDADFILTLLTRQSGKVSALARSARRSRRRFGGALEPFTVISVALKSKSRSELWTAERATVVESFEAIAADVVAYAHASYATEVARELLADEQPESDVFDLLVELYREIGSFGPSRGTLRAFELRLLAAAGLGPRFDGCIDCGRNDLDEGIVFDPNLGGAVCSQCAARSTGHGVRPLSEAARLLLCELAGCRTLREAAHVDSPAAVEARDLLVGFIRFHLPRQLKSLDFLVQLRGQ